jgi:predicted amidohydrolase
MPGSVSFRETDTRLPGDRAVVASTGPAVLGLSVCYDLRFPELYRELTARGAEILTVPSAFTYPTGQAHWKLLLRARAVENQAWVIAPNQYGEAGYGFADYGHSMIIDPWGRVLAEAGDDEDMVLTCELDAAVLDKVRRELPSADHRRM